MSTAGPAGGDRQGYAEVLSAAQQAASSPAPAFDVDEAMEGIPGDIETARELAGLFIEEYGSVAGKMRQGLEAGNTDAVRRGAHMLKSSAGVFAAHSAVVAAERLELVAADGDVTAAAAALVDLEREAARLIASLKEHFGAE